MDHKVSKDMISSGMIPSGEKTQADLGRTQYGSAPSPSSLMEAYRSIYEHHQKDADGKVIEHGGKEELKEERVIGGGVSTSLPKQKQYQKIIDKLTGYEQTQKGVGAAGLIPDSAFSNPNPRRSDTRPSPTKTTSPLPKKTPKPEVKPVPKPTPKPAPKPFRYKIDKSNMINTGLDLFDLVKGVLIDEGCSEQEAIKIMVNLSEEEKKGLLQKVGDFFNIKKKIDNKLNQMRNTSPIGGNKRVDDVRAGSGDSSVGKKINF